MKASPKGISLCILFFILLLVVGIFLGPDTSVYFTTWVAYPLSAPITRFLVDTIGLPIDDFILGIGVSFVLVFGLLYLVGAITDKIFKKVT